MTHTTRHARTPTRLLFFIVTAAVGAGCGGPTDSADLGVPDAVSMDQADVADDGVTGGDTGTDGDMSTTADAGSCEGPDADGDGVPDPCDRCALGADQLDADRDTVPDACDRCVGFSDLVDSDMDGVPDGCDVCAMGNDADDADDDDIPDACDVCDLGPNGPDADADGTPDACDLCDGHSDAADDDMDGVPNGCDVCAGHDDDLDEDGDGVANGCDVCAGHDDGVDTDMDGAADGCDCAPDSPESRPGLVEICDGLDNDCVGGVDDGLVGCALICAPGRVDWDLDGVDCEAEGRVVYVDADAVGSADGSSWANAYTSIEAAIVDAEATPEGRKQIWVAAGSYTPTRVLATGPLSTRGFLMPASTALLGGFAGDERSATAAAPATHVTSLQSSPGSFTRVLEVRQPDVRVDGFRVSLVLGSFAVVYDGTLQASRIDVLGETSAVAFATISVLAGDVVLREARLAGGNVGIESLGGTMLCDRCAVSGHTAGGVRIDSGAVTLRNSAVIDNTVSNGTMPSATGPAGGVTILASGGRLRAENATIAGNTGSRMIAAGVFAPAGLDVQLGSATLVNSIVQANGGDGTVVATVTASSVERRPGACDPLFTDPTTIPGIQLGAGSLCIDAGNTAMSQGPLDLAGAPRIQGAAVDMGALESQP